MKVNIYAILAIVLALSLFGNKYLYDQGKVKSRAIETLTAENSIRAKEAKLKDEVIKRHDTDLENTRKKLAATERRLEGALAGVPAWATVSVPSTIVDGVRELGRQAGGSDAAGEPDDRADGGAPASRSDER